MTALDLVRPGHALHLDSLFGALLCGTATVLLVRRAVSLQTVDYGILAGASAIVAGQLLTACSLPTAPPTRLYFAGVFLFVAAFSSLPVRFAALYSALLYAALAALSLTRAQPGDTTLLLELAVVVMLIAHLSIFGRQISSERSEAQLNHTLARTDPLTGLCNRRGMARQLEEIWSAGGTAPRGSLLLLDIDHFKAVNDVHGHHAGDQVLQAVGRLLVRTCRGPDTVSRWGGEEFLILLPDAEPDAAVRVAGRVLSAVREARMPHGHPVTLSCGVVGVAEVGALAEGLHLADARLYAAKHAGRDQVMSGRGGPVWEPAAGNPAPPNASAS